LTIIISLTTIHYVYKVAKQYGIEHKASTMLFIGLQPLYFQLSFRFYTEIWAALTIIMMLYYWNEKKYLVVALISSYAFGVRQELALISLVLAVYFVYKKQWYSILALGWMPLVLNILGWIKTGNVLWLLNDYMPMHHNIGNAWKMGFWVYFENFFNVFGIIIGVLFFLGARRYKKYSVPLTMFVVMFLFYSVLAEPSFGLGRGQGSTRHILVLSPILALFAGIGFDHLKTKLGKELGANLPLIVIPLLVLNLVIQEPPKELSQEGQIMKEIVTQLPADEDVYSNHVFASYFLGRKTKMIRPPLGEGYILYDSHYGYRPSWDCTMRPDTMKNVKWIAQRVSEDRKFAVLIGYKGEYQ
jgi:hypothetical protein